MCCKNTLLSYIALFIINCILACITINSHYNVSKTIYAETTCVVNSRTCKQINISYIAEDQYINTTIELTILNRIAAYNNKFVCFYNTCLNTTGIKYNKTLCDKYINYYDIYLINAIYNYTMVDVIPYLLFTNKFKSLGFVNFRYDE